MSTHLRWNYSMIVKMKKYALRRGLWWSCLSIEERGLITATIKLLSVRRKYIISEILTNIINNIAEKLRFHMRRIYYNLMSRGMKLAVRWVVDALKLGYKRAIKWLKDPGYLTYLGVFALSISGLIE